MIDLNQALKHLHKDKKLSPALKRYDKPVFSRKGHHGGLVTPFEALVESIIYQQLAGKAAFSILTKFLKLFPSGTPTPEKLLRLTDAQLRGAGISPQKLSYLRDLAKKFKDGTIDPKKIHRLEDEKVREHLIAVKGIGRWTADMFLMFYLHRPDVFPVGDLGIQKGFQKLHGMRGLPSASRMERQALLWAPWRTVAACYLWRIADDGKK